MEKVEVKVVVAAEVELAAEVKERAGAQFALNLVFADKIERKTLRSI